MYSYQNEFEIVKKIQNILAFRSPVVEKAEREM